MNALAEIVRTALRNRERSTRIYPTPEAFNAIMADVTVRDTSPLFASEELARKIRISACSQAIKTWEKSVLASGYNHG